MGTVGADWQAVRMRLASGIREYFSANGFTKAVLGLSGGLDSALTAKLACESLGAGNVIMLIMPERGVSSTQATKQAGEFAESLGAKYFTTPINPIIEAVEKSNRPMGAQSKLARMNLRARIRMLLLYSFANSNKALVLGTGNRSEILLGYFTKHGDEAADLLVLGELWKSQVYGLAEHMKLPRHFLERKPSAELYKGQSDEAELGAGYAELDKILALFVEAGKSAQEITDSGAEKKVVEAMLRRVKSTEHKRKKPPAVSSGLLKGT